jgi:hypothetical protein
MIVLEAIQHEAKENLKPAEWLDTHMNIRYKIKKMEQKRILQQIQALK